MKPQLSFPLGRIFVLILGSLVSFALPLRAAAAPPACTSANINPGPNDPVAFVVAATSPGAVSVFDLATNTVVCSIAVGNNPSHLALSADSSLLLVENDADATVSVINLADGSTAATLSLSPILLTAGTSGVTGNIAATFDGTHSFAYVAVYPNPFPSTLPTGFAPVLGRINLDVSPPVITNIGTANVGTAPANGDVGVSFLPDGSKAYITFDGNNTDVYTTSNDTFSASIPVTGGSFAVSPVGDLGYEVQTAAAVSSAAPNQITIATNAFAATGAATGQTVCSRSNTVTTSPDGTVAYYSCPANNSLQFITASANTITNTVNLATAGSGPNGIAATSDGSLLVVANNNSTISIFTSPASSPTEANFPGPGGALVGVGQRPVKPVIAPNTPQNVATSKTLQFTATTAYGIRPATNISTIVWSVNNVSGGNSTVGTISATGLYTAPPTPPAPATVTVTATVTSTEFFRNSKLYPGQSGSASVAVTVTPSQLAFTTAPQNLTAGACSTSITVQSQDSLGNPSNPTTTETLVLASSSGGTFFSDSACSSVITMTSIPTTANSATFFYQDTKSGSPTVTVTGSGSFSATQTQTETVSAAAATHFVVSAPGTATAGAAFSFTVTAEDQFTNTATGYAGTVHFTSSDGGSGVVLPTNSTLTNGMGSFSATLKTAASQTITATDTLTSSINGTSGAIVVSAGTASKLVFTTTAQAQTTTLQPVSSGVLGGNTTPLPSVFVAVQDANGNLVNTSAASIVVTSSPANVTGTTTVAAVNGVATFSNLQFTIAGTYTLTAASTGLTSTASSSFTLTTNITVTITSSFTSVKIEDLPAANTFTALANGDPNSPSLGVTWVMLSCGGSTTNLAACGSVASNGAYTAPNKVPLAPANTFTVQATAVADSSKTATSGSLTITSAIRLSMPSVSALIGGPVDFTPKATSGNVNLGSGANQSDLNLGVTLAIAGTCAAPPNYTFSGNDGNGCGSFNGSQTASPPTYAYTAPAVVPMSSSCAAIPASCLGTQNKAQITVTAKSVADPNQPSVSTTFMISSNISFGVALGTDATTLKNICNPFVYSSTDTNILAELTNDPCGFAPAAPRTPVPTLAVGFVAALAESPNPQGFGSVTGLTWVASSGSVPASSATSTTFTAPTAVPNTNGGAATITAYAVADFTKSAAFPLPIVASKLIPHNIAPPFSLVVQSGQTSGTISLDFEGPTSGTITFSCPSFSNLTNSSCSFNPNPSNATGTTTVTMTLTITRTGSGHLQPLGIPLGSLPALPGAVLDAIVLVVLILAFAYRKRAFVAFPPRLNSAAATILLCALVMTWAVACGQFSPPATPQQPIGGTPAATGFATVMSSPTTDSSSSTDSLPVPATVQP